MPRFSGSLFATLLTALVAMAIAAPIGRAQTQLLPIVDEPPARLFVSPPIPERLALGGVFIPYRVENFRVLPLFGAAALAVSPRTGHLHITVDDSPWHWADTGGHSPIVIVGLPPGPHKVLIELATPDHRVIARETVAFVVPNRLGAHSH